MIRVTSFGLEPAFFQPTILKAPSKARRALATLKTPLATNIGRKFSDVPKLAYSQQQQVRHSLTVRTVK